MSGGGATGRAAGAIPLTGCAAATSGFFVNIPIYSLDKHFQAGRPHAGSVNARRLEACTPASVADHECHRHRCVNIFPRSPNLWTPGKIISHRDQRSQVVVSTATLVTHHTALSTPQCMLRAHFLVKRSRVPGPRQLASESPMWARTGRSPIAAPPASRLRRARSRTQA